MATPETSPEQSDESADPAVQLAEIVTAGLERFDELSDEEVEDLEEKITELRELTERPDGWRGEGLLGRERVVFDQQTSESLMDAAASGSVDVVIATPGGVKHLWSTPELNAETPSDIDIALGYELAEGSDGDVMFSEDGRYLAWDGADKKIVVAVAPNRGAISGRLVASGPSGDETELWAVSSTGDVLVENERRRKTKLDLMRPDEEKSKLKRIGELDINNQGELRQVEFDPNGSWFAYYIDDRIRLVEADPNSDDADFETIWDSGQLDTPVDTICPVGGRVIMHQEDGFMISAANGKRKRLAVEGAGMEVVKEVGDVNQMIASPDGSFLAVASGSEVLLYALHSVADLAKMVQIGKYSGESDVRARFSTVSDAVLLYEENGTVRTFKLRS